MDNYEVIYIMGIMGLGGFGALGVLAFGAFRVIRESQERICELSTTYQKGLTELYSQYADSLENHKAIDQLGVDGMRGVVARGQNRPSVLDTEPEEDPEPSPDKIGDQDQYIEVGLLAGVGPEDFGTRHSPERKEL